MYLMTADEIREDHYGGRVKIKLASGQVVEDVLEDVLFDADCIWAYVLELREFGSLYIGMDVIFEWSAE